MAVNCSAISDGGLLHDAKFPTAGCLLGTRVCDPSSILPYYMYPNYVKTVLK